MTRQMQALNLNLNLHALHFTFIKKFQISLRHTSIYIWLFTNDINIYQTSSSPQIALQKPSTQFDLCCTWSRCVYKYLVCWIQPCNASKLLMELRCALRNGVAQYQPTMRIQMFCLISCEIYLHVVNG